MVNGKSVFLVSVLMLLYVMAFADSETARFGPSVDFSNGPLKVSDNKRFLVHENGKPFFYLGDTAWELFHRLNREEAERYLENRRRKGFTVIQAVGLAELDGLNTPNPYGEKPLFNNDPSKANDKYFDHVDYIINTAARKGMYIGFLPTWGDKVTKAWGVGPIVFKTDADGYAYGKFLGERYKSKPNIIWILGGDRNADNRESIYRAMAKGIKDAGDTHLMTYHPQGDSTSAKWFHKDEWLDFNMLQSGHGSYDKDNYNRVFADYKRNPVKPCMDGEPRYENHPVNWNPKNGWFDDFDSRQAAYWGLFAGGFGHTYGCHDIWQMMAPGRKPISSARNSWYKVMDLPGAHDMKHVRDLMESRPFLSRVPDQSVLASGAKEKGQHIRATRGDGYIFVYTPYGDAMTVKTGNIKGKRMRGWWFDPRTGESQSIGELPNSARKEFNPPGESKRGNDWVLVLDDCDKNYPPPGLSDAKRIDAYLSGMSTDCPVIYDNDWWRDVTDQFYLWAHASLGDVDLRGNVVSRDMWNWQGGYQFKMEQSLEDAKRAVGIARRSGMKNIPDPVAGANLAFARPTSGKIEDTKVIRSVGSDLIVAEARKASSEKPLVVFVGGPINTVANAYLIDPSIAECMIVCMTDLRGYNGKDKWANHIVATRCRLINYGAHIWWPQRPLPPVMPLERFKELPDNELTREMHRIARMFWDRSTKKDRPDRDDGFGDGAPIFFFFNPAIWIRLQPQKAVGEFNVQDVKITEPFDLLDARECDYRQMTEDFYSVFKGLWGTK